MLNCNFTHLSHRQVAFSLATVFSLLASVASSNAMELDDAWRTAPVKHQSAVSFNFDLLAERCVNECKTINFGFRDHQMGLFAGAWKTAYYQNQNFLLPFQDVFFNTLDAGVGQGGLLGRQASIIKHSYVELIEIFATPEPLQAPAKAVVPEAPQADAKVIVAPGVKWLDLCDLLGNDPLEINQEKWICVNTDQVGGALQGKGAAARAITLVGKAEEISDDPKFKGIPNVADYKGKLVATYQIEGVGTPLYLILQ